MREYQTRFPNSEVLLFQPERNEFDLFFSNIFSFRSRRRVVELAYDATRRNLRARRKTIGPMLAPYGITLVADLFSAMMVVLAGLMGLAVIVYSLATLDEARESFAYHPLYHVLLMGVCGAFVTGDLFNLYVWFEVLLISSCVLMALGGERPQLEGAIKYVTLNLIASALFLAAVGILYGVCGTLNMAELSVALASGPWASQVARLGGFRRQYQITV